MDSLEKKNQSFLENNIQELIKDTSQWELELDLIVLEIRFIKLFLGSFPFSAERPNLFERLQTFIQKLEAMEDPLAVLLEKLHSHKKELTTIHKKVDSPIHFYTINHDIIREELNGMMQEYKQLKWEIYEYSDAIIEE